MDKESYNDGYKQGYLDGFSNGKKRGITQGNDDYMKNHLWSSLILIAVAVIAYFVLV